MQRIVSVTGAQSKFLLFMASDCLIFSLLETQVSLNFKASQLLKSVQDFYRKIDGSGGSAAKLKNRSEV